MQVHVSSLQSFFDDKQKSSVLLICDQVVQIFEETQKSIQDEFGDILCSGMFCSIQMCVSVHICKENDYNFHEYFQGRACFHVSNIPFKNQKPTIILFGDAGTYCIVQETVCDYENGKPPLFSKEFLCQSHSAIPEPVPKKAEGNPFMTQSCRLLNG